MTIVDTLLAAGWSPDQIVGAGFILSALLACLGTAAAAKGGGQEVDESVTPSLDLAPEPLPERTPDTTFDEHADTVVEIFSPIDEPDAYAAQVVDMAGITWSRVSLPAVSPGFWRSEHGVYLGWDLLRVRHPKQTSAGITAYSSPQVLQLADDSIPLEDIHVEDLPFMGSVLADIDDLETCEDQR